MKLKEKIVMTTISVGKRLFYNTPIQRLPIVTKMYVMIFRSAYSPGQITSVNYMGVDIRIPTDDITILPSLINQDYEKLELALIKQLLRPGMVAVDVGANIGIHTIIMSHAVGSKGKLISFEPEPSNFALLKENIRDNKCKNVTLVDSAVGDTRTKLILYIDKGSIGTHSLLDRDRTGEVRGIEVDVTSLDKFFNTPIKINLLKIDVEGYEALVLKGAKRTLLNVDHIFFEYIKPSKEIEKTIALYKEGLKDFNYIYLVDEKRGRVETVTLGVVFGKQYANVIASKKRLTMSVVA